MAAHPGQERATGGPLAPAPAGGAVGTSPIPIWRLREVSARPSFPRYMRALWGRRFFIAADARAKAFATARGTLLGKTWLILRPFLDALFFFVIFGLLLKTGRGIDNFLAYLVVGLNVFSLLQVGFVSGSGIIPANMNLIRAFAFPRAAVVFSWALKNLLDFVPILAATLLFIVVIPPGVFPSWTWLFAVPAILLSWIFGLGTGLIVASLTTWIQDLKHIWPLFSRFWFYASGIFFSLERFVESPKAYTVMTANPGYQLITLARKTLVYSELPPLADWRYSALWSFGMLAVGLVVFWFREESYGRAS